MTYQRRQETMQYSTGQSLYVKLATIGSKTLRSGLLNRNLNLGRGKNSRDFTRFCTDFDIVSSILHIDIHLVSPSIRHFSYTPPRYNFFRLSTRYAIKRSFLSAYPLLLPFPTPSLLGINGNSQPKSTNNYYCFFFFLLHPPD